MDEKGKRNLKVFVAACTAVVLFSMGFLTGRSMNRTEIVIKTLDAPEKEVEETTETELSRSLPSPAAETEVKSENAVQTVPEPNDLNVLSAQDAPVEADAPEAPVENTGEVVTLIPENNSETAGTRETVTEPEKAPEPATQKPQEETKEPPRTENNNSGLVNINTATEAELKSLPGIGDTLSQRIIEYRNAHGAFKSIHDIKNVSGIGDKRFEAIRDLITV